MLKKNKKKKKRKEKKNNFVQHFNELGEEEGQRKKKRMYTGKSGAKFEISWAPVFWSIATFPWRCSIYAFFAFTLVVKMVFYSTLLGVFFFSSVFSLALFAGAVMPVTASQQVVYNVVGNVAGFVLDAFNEVIAEPYNNVYECMRSLRLLYNSLVAFVESIVSTIAAEFNVDIFGFAYDLRDAAEDYNYAKATAALYERMEAETQAAAGPHTGTAQPHKYRILLRAQRVAKALMRFHGMQDGARWGDTHAERITLTQIIQALCGVVDFLFGFLIAFIDTFKDFFTLLLELILQIVVIVVVNWEGAEFVEILVELLLTLMLDLIDPNNCFHPFNTLPQSIFPCLCDDVYDTIDDVPNNIINALAGCICPGFNINGDILEDMLKPCAKYPVLSALISVIEAIMNWIGDTINVIQNTLNQILGVFRQVSRLWDIAKSLFRRIKKLFRSKIRAGTRRNVPVSEGGGYIEVYDILDDDGNIVDTFEEYGFDTELRDAEFEICLVRAENISRLLDEAVLRRGIIHKKIQAHRARVESLKELGVMTEVLSRSFYEARNENVMNVRLDKARALMEYIRKGRSSVAHGVVLNAIYKRLIKPIPKAKRTEHQLPDWALNEDCGPECAEDYRTAFRGVLRLAGTFFDKMMERYHQHGERGGEYDHSRPLGGAVTPQEFSEEFKKRGINIMDIGLAAMRTSVRMRRAARHVDSHGNARAPGEEMKQTVAEALMDKMLKKIARGMLNTRAKTSPESLPRAVETILTFRPNFADMVEEELDAVEREYQGYEKVKEMLHGYHNGTLRRGPDGGLHPEDANFVRRAMHAGSRNIRASVYKRIFGHAPGEDYYYGGTAAGRAAGAGKRDFKNETEWHEDFMEGAEAEADRPWWSFQINGKRVIVITLVLGGGTVLLCGIQAAAVAITALCPLLIVLIIALLPIIFLALPIAADGVIEGVNTVFNGGNPQGMDYISPFIHELKPIISDSFSQGYESFEIGEFFSTAGDIAEDEVHYVISMALRQVLCFVPTAQLLNECPPKPRVDATGRPAVKTGRWLWEAVKCDPTQFCVTPLDCSGEAPCFSGFRETSVEAPCDYENGEACFCKCYPYAYEDLLDEVVWNSQIEPECDALGWDTKHIMPYQVDSNWEMVRAWFRSSYQSLKFTSQRLSTGVFLPWVALGAWTLTIIPCLSGVADPMVSSTFWLNLLSMVYVPFSTWMLVRFVPAQDYWLLGPVAKEVVTFFRFPNYQQVGWKGEPTVAMWLCYVANTPQVAASSIIISLILTLISTFVLASGVMFILGMIIDIFLFIPNFVALVVREAWASTVLYRRRQNFLLAYYRWAGKPVPQQAYKFASRSMEHQERLLLLQNAKVDYQKHPSERVRRTMLPIIEGMEKEAREEMHPAYRYKSWPNLYFCLHSAYKAPLFSMRRLMKDWKIGE